MPFRPELLPLALDNPVFDLESVTENGRLASLSALASSMSHRREVGQPRVQAERNELRIPLAGAELGRGCQSFAAWPATSASWRGQKEIKV